jgi:thiamine biosynthesis lipoprotein
MKPAITIICAVLLTACQPTPEVQKITGFAQGTTYSIGFWVEQPIDIDQLSQEIDDELRRIDLVMSNYRPDSVIEQFNQSPAGTSLNPEIHQLMKKGRQVHHATQGCYDPTSLALFELWGFSNEDFSIPNESSIEQTLTRVGLERLNIEQTLATQPNPPLHLDLSSIGQGYAVTQLADILEQHGVSHHLVEIGGEMMATGFKPDGKPWRIGVERPVPNSQHLNAIITIKGPQATAVMTSGTYRHYYDRSGTRYSHIIDPRTGHPVTHNTVAVTVLMNDATLADAWSTGLLCLGAEVGMQAAEQHGIAAVFYELNGEELHHLMSQAASRQHASWTFETVD